MAQEQQPQQQEQPTPMNAIYPAPPPFYKNFTKQNVNELKRLRKGAGIATAGPSQSDQTNGDYANGESKKDLDILSLPPELRYLIPPQPPSDGTYTTFGQPKSLSPKDLTLADHGIEQLYPDHPSVHKNPQPHLIALARSMLTKYLHILGVLSNNPGDYEGSTKELETIVFNINDLINKYRPHQARETLILMMEERVEKLRQEIKGIDDGARRARELLEGFETDAQKLEHSTGDKPDEGEDGEDGGAQNMDAARKARQEYAWTALERDMGAG